MENKKLIPGNSGITYPAAGAAIGTALAAIAGTALAVPATIGLGTGFLVWGITKLVKGEK